MENQPLLQTGIGMSRRKRIACYAILLTVILERIAFYAVVGNLVVFLSHKPMNFLAGNASEMLLLYTGLAYFTSLFGGWIADSTLGRFSTIFFAFIIYMCCYIFLPLLYPYPYNIHMWDSTSQNISFICHAGNESPERSLLSENCAFAVLVPLCVMAIGIGAVKANIAPFGADQIRGEGPSASRFFFNWFYWCINIGAFIGVGVLSYVQQIVNFFWGYLIPLITLFLAFFIFSYGARFYIRKPPVGSILTTTVKILAQSCMRRKWNIRHQSSLDSSTEQSSITSQEAVQVSAGCLDRAKLRYGGSFEEQLVDDVGKLGKVVLIFFTMVPYWLVYYQMQTTFLVQGLHMNLRVPHSCSNSSSSAAMDNMFSVPAASLQLFDIIALIILIPIFDRLIYPFLDRRGYQISLRTRISLGMVISALAMVTAALIEMWRHEIVQHVQCNQTLDLTTYVAADLTVFWQIPQYVLIGVSEVLASITGLEMAYVEAPKSMQGIVLGIFWSINGLASFLGICLLNVFKGTWFHYTPSDPAGINCADDQGHCHLDYYFFTLAALQITGLALFSLCARSLKMGIRDPQLAAATFSRTRPGSNTAS